ncbi:MAG: DUF4097 family beta strand repeat protein [Sedimentisphaerales bacterium]|nr:DUF4097 family beta strand repeat protein [Sedimentisphaerales bacterium]
MKNRHAIHMTLSSMLCLAVLLAGCCINFGCVMLGKYERTVELSAPLSSGSTFVAKTHNGSITIHGADVTECRLTATIVTRAANDEEAEELSDQVEVTLVPSGDRLTAKIDQPTRLINKSVSVSYDILIPNERNLELTSHNGAVHINDIIGRINATTHNGKMNAENISGSTVLTTHNGHVTCKDISGDSTLHTHNGGVDVVYSETAPSVCNVSIVTHNGGIDFASPPDFSAHVDASTHNGSVHTDLPITVKGKVSKSKLTGTIGTGEGKLHLETHNGSIKIR